MARVLGLIMGIEDLGPAGSVDPDVLGLLDLVAGAVGGLDKEATKAALLLLVPGLFVPASVGAGSGTTLLLLVLVPWLKLSVSPRPEVCLDPGDPPGTQASLDPLAVPDL